MIVTIIIVLLTLVFLSVMAVFFLLQKGLYQVITALNIIQEELRKLEEKK
jgi:multisubunit Na+/H+ antiporter MnhC subunit